MSAVVDIIMRTKDRPILLRRAVTDVLGQSYASWHLILVNDGGDPSVVESVLTPFKSALGDRLTVIHHDRSLGMEAASNAGIRRGSGEFIVIHDDDDSWEPGFLNRTVSVLTNPRAPSMHGVVTRTRRVLERLEADRVVETGRDEFNPDFSYVSLPRMAAGNQFPPISFVFKRVVAERIGLFDESLPVLGDWDFHYRYLLDCDIEVIPETLANYHHRPAIGKGDMNAYGNTVIAGFDRHRYYENILRNKWLREDVRAGRIGKGTLHVEALYSKEADEWFWRVFNLISKKSKKFFGVF